MEKKQITKKVADGLRGVFPQAFITNDLADVSRMDPDKWLIRVRYDRFLVDEDIMSLGMSPTGLMYISVVIRSHVGARDVDDLVDVGVTSVYKYLQTQYWKLDGITFDGDGDYHEATMSLFLRVDQ